MADSVQIVAREPHGGDGGARFDFSISTNPYGPPESLMSLLHKLPVDTYVDDAGWRPRNDRIAQVDGAGTTELIYRICRVFAAPGETTLILDATFGEYARAARVAGLTVAQADSRRVQRLPDRTRLVWLCQPNNPDGRILSREHLDALVQLCRARDATLVIDAAFAPLCSEPVPLPEPADDLIVLHSPTKAFSVPGIRYGFAECGSATAERLAAAAPPWLLGSAARALRDWSHTDAAASFLRDTVPRHLDDARRLQHALAEQGWAVRRAPTGYFIVDEPEAALLCERARRAGFALRSLTSFGLTGVRIGARRPEANRALLDWFATQRRGR